MVRLADSQGRAVRCHDLVRHDVVACQAEAPGQPAHAAAKGEPANSGVRHVASRRRQAELLCGTVQVAKESTAAYPRTAYVRIHTDGAHARQIDQQSIVWHADPQDAVATASDAGLEVVLAGEVDGGRHIRVADAAHGHSRVTIDHRVPDAAGRVITIVAWQQDLAVNTAAELAHVGQAGVIDHAYSSPPFSSSADAFTLVGRGYLVPILTTNGPG